MFPIFRSSRLFIQHFKRSSPNVSKILPYWNMHTTKTLVMFRFSFIPNQNLHNQGLLTLSAASIPLLGQTIQLESPSQDLDQLEKLANTLGEKPLEKKGDETYDAFHTRYSQFLFKKVLETCERQETWKLNRLDKQVLNRLRDTNGNSLLISAAIEAPRAIPWLVQEKIALDTSDAKGNTALHIASSLGKQSIIPHLSFQIQERNYDQKTPLHLAIEYGQVEILPLLVHYMDMLASCPVLGVDGSSALALAVYFGHLPCYKYLANGRCKEELSSPVPTHGSFLHIALQSKNSFMLPYLLTKQEHLGHINSKNSDYDTPLMLACKRGDIEAIGSLMEKGADPTLRGKEGKQATHFAAEADLNTLKKLSSYVDLALLETKDGQGRRPEDFLDDHSKSTWNVHLQALKNVSGKSPDYSTYPPHNLAIQGGGPKGIAYLGAIEKLEEEGLLDELKRVAGTSAGAILATLLAVGYTYEELYEILMNFDIQHFLDATSENERFAKAAFKSAQTQEKGPVLQALLGEQIQDICHLKPKKLYNKLSGLTGLFEGEKFLTWIDELIEKKTGKKNCTFKELQTCIRKNPDQFKQLHIYATRVTPTFSETHFSSEDKDWEDLVISSAVRASMSIPGVFRPHQLLYKSKEGAEPHTREENKYVDGGLLNNFPLDTFDSQAYKLPGDITWGGKTNPRTLGLCLKEIKNENPEERKLDNAEDLGSAIASLYFECETLKSFANPTNQKRYIQIPVKLGLLDFDATKQQKEEAIQAGRDATKALKAPPLSEREIPRSNFNKWDLHPNFVGRTATLQKIAEHFRREKVCVLFGLPGMGKTQTALQYANQNPAKFSQIWVVNCKSEAEKNASYQEIAKKLNLDYLLDTHNEEVIQKGVHQRLEENSSKPWLLLFDNVTTHEDLESLPQKGGKILITTNQPGVWSNKKDQLYIDALTPDEACQLLGQITEEPSSNEMEQLAQQLGYFPLALTLSANCIRETTTIAEFLKDFDPVSTSLSKDQYYEHTIQTVWKKMLTTIEEREPLALKWLEICTHLDPGHLPTSWIGEWLEEKGESRGQAVEIQQILTSYAVFRKTENHEYTMHSLLQKVIRNKTSEVSAEAKKSKTETNKTSSRMQQEALLLVKKHLDRFEQNDHTTWKFGRQAALHMYWLINEKLLDPIDYDTHFSLIRDSGYISNVSQDLDYAERFNQIALQLAQTKYQTAPHPDIASSLNNLGLVWHEKGNFTKALQFHEKALAMKKQLHGETPNPHTANSLNNLGEVWRDKGDFTKALQFHKEALAMQKQLHSETPHLDTACSLNNLGLVWYDKGDFTKALQFHKETLAMQKQLHGETPHPHTATSLNNLGAVWRYKGDLTESLQFHEEALAMRKQLHGETPNSHTASSLNNLGAVWHEKGDFTKALQFHEEALSMRKQLHGETPHPHTANSLNNLGEVWHDKGDLTKALQFHEEALSMRKQLHGETPHLDIATSLNNLGEVWRDRGDFTKALECLQQSHRIFQKVYGKDHPSTQKVKKNIDNLKKCSCTIL
ncbi:MAG: Photosystem I assembly protein Ycf3 [Chlamydiae bacterium]|nr:Photosystem I assembly protein Ycf3 [Chlamydiota bacterium]